MRGGFDKSGRREKFIATAKIRIKNKIPTKIAEKFQ